MLIEKKIEEMGLVLPQDLTPGGLYKLYRRVGNMIYLAGQASYVNDDYCVKGAVGNELTVEQGREAAKISALRILSVLKDALGDLDKVKQFVQMICLVRCENGYDNPPLVIDAAAEIFYELYGDAGLPARMATGAAMLPDGCTTEIMLVVEVEE